MWTTAKQKGHKPPRYNQTVYFDTESMNSTTSYQTRTTAYLRTLNTNKRLKVKNRRANLTTLLQKAEPEWR